MLKIVLVVVGMWEGLALEAYSQSVVVTDDTFTGMTLEGHLWHWADTSHQLRPLQILAIRRSGAGEILWKSIPNMGDGDESHWVVFDSKHQGRATQQVVMEVYSSKLDAIECFLFSQQKLIRSTPVYSWKTPVWNRDLPYRAFTYKLEMMPNERQTILLRVVKKNGVLSIPIRLHEQKHFTASVQREYFMHGLTQGVMLLAFGLGIALFLLSKQWLYFFYAGHIVGIAVLLLAENHYLNQYLLDYSKLIAGPSAWAIGAMISIVCHTCFSWLFLKTGIFNRTIWALLGWGIIAIAGTVLGWLSVGFPLTDALAQFVLLFCLSYILIAFTLLLRSVYRRTPGAYLYMAAISPFWILALLTVLNILGNIPWFWFVKEIIDYGPVLEVAILCVGLAYTFQRDQREKLKGQLIISRLNEEVRSAHTDGQGAERKRIAYDLHDNLGGMVSAIRLTIEAMDASTFSQKEHEVYQHVLGMTRQAYNEIRLLSHNLQPDELEKFGLAQALQRLMAKLNNSQSIQFSLSMPPADRLAKDLEFNLYSICMELANNIIKHSQATEASFEFILRNGQMQVLVSDNGQGFIHNNTSDGMGMRTVQERTEQMGGTLNIHSRPGEGTLFEFSIPLSRPTHVSAQT